MGEKGIQGDTQRERERGSIRLGERVNERENKPRPVVEGAGDVIAPEAGWCEVFTGTL